MTKGSAAFGSAIFLLLAPGTVAGVIPWWISRWRFETLGAGWLPLRAIGVALMIGGAAVLLDSFVRFALHGLGTPAPILPPEKLVVTGWYRYVRNPMYVAVLALITGQGLLFGSLAIIAYAALVFVLVHLFVIGYEEPKLRSTFGAGYEAFLSNVPRWIPRRTPWSSMISGPS